MLRPNSRADRTLADDLWDAAVVTVFAVLAGIGVVWLLLGAMFD
jgi:hypothetical protein